MARTLMARIPRLFRTRTYVPLNKSHSCRFGIILDDFLFQIGKWYIVCTIPMRTHNIHSYWRKSKRYPYYASWPGAMINTHQLELPLFRTYFHSPKGVRAIEIRLYLVRLSSKTYVFEEKWLSISQFDYLFLSEFKLCISKQCEWTRF